MYYLVSPYSSKNNGLSNYCLSARDVLNFYGIKADIIYNDEKLKPAEFEKKILSVIKDDDYVEIPDSWGLFSDSKLPNKSIVRLHAPSGFLQEINGANINEARYKREKRLANKCKIITSPSKNNLEKYHLEKNDKKYIFPNPISIKESVKLSKDIDFIFIGRFDKVKGADYLREVLLNLQEHTTVKILGIEKKHAIKYKGCIEHLNIRFEGWVDNEIKNNLIKRSKVCLILSRFESYSMVAAEAILSRTKVIAWDVGGIRECFPEHLVTLVPIGLISQFSSLANKLLTQGELTNAQTIGFVENNNKAYIRGVLASINKYSKCYYNLYNNFPVYAPSGDLYNTKSAASERYLKQNKINIFGYSMMNEHAEEMWGCLHRVIKSYEYVSRKPLGYNVKFGRSFNLNNKKFHVYDWRFNLERLEKNIKDSNPDVIFVFNGNTKYFDEAKARLEKAYKLPFVFSELGWLPQKGHIYFDDMGSNYQSRISKSTLEDLCGYIDDKKISRFSPRFKRALLALQLPGDTTLDKPSFPRQLKHEDLITYVRNSIPSDWELVVRKHPRDENKYDISHLRRTSYDLSSNTDSILNSVDAVVGVNSTFLLEALQYKVNVYNLGHAIFSNKQISIDCTRDDLKDLWKSAIEINYNRRKCFLNFLKKTQLNVSYFNDKKKLVGSDYFPIYPIIKSIEKNKRDLFFNHDQNSEKIEKVTMKKSKLTFKQNFLSNFILKRSPGSKVNKFFSIIPGFYEFLFLDLFNEILRKKNIGQDLENEFKKISKIQKYIPRKVFLYHRTRWIYYGVDKAMTLFCKSALISNLDVKEKMTCAAILCESGNYSHALKLASSCLKVKNDIFRSSQYLRLAHHVYQYKELMNSLPKDEKLYINRLDDCFNRLVADQVKLPKYLQLIKNNWIVIGNSPNMRGTKKGKFINTVKAVARFNEFNMSLESRADYGKKIDIWVKSPTFEEVSRIPTESLKLVYVTGTNHIDRSPSAYDFFYDLILNREIIIGITPSKLYKELAIEFKNPPSGGIQFLNLLKDTYGRLPKDRVIGFSFNLKEAMKGPKGQINQKAKYNHNWIKEISYIQNRIVK